MPAPAQVRAVASGVRPFTHADLESIVDMSRRFFPPKRPLPREAHLRLFRRFFLEHPWFDEAIPSLVSEDPTGRVTGFLGVTTRPVQMQGRRYVLAISQQFMVEPDRRGTLAAVPLLKTFLAGPQDLSITGYSGELARRIWCSLGGATSYAHSLFWTQRLRPVALIATDAAGIPARRLLRRLLAAVSPMADAALARRPSRRFHAPPAGSAADVETPALLALQEELGDRRHLRPAYDLESFGWLISLLEEQRQMGELQKVMVRDEHGRPAGWFVYFLRRGGVCEVVQIGGSESSMELVLAHLVHHAWKGGALALNGRVDPRVMRAYLRSGADVLPGMYWMLVHARLPELRLAVQEGACALTETEADLTFL